MLVAGEGLLNVVCIWHVCLRGGVISVKGYWCVRLRYEKRWGGADLKWYLQFDFNLLLRLEKGRQVTVWETRFQIPGLCCSLEPSIKHCRTIAFFYLSLKLFWFLFVILGQKAVFIERVLTYYLTLSLSILTGIQLMLHSAWQERLIEENVHIDTQVSDWKQLQTL